MFGISMLARGIYLENMEAYEQDKTFGLPEDSTKLKNLEKSKIPTKVKIHEKNKSPNKDEKENFPSGTKKCVIEPPPIEK